MSDSRLGCSGRIVLDAVLFVLVSIVVGVASLRV
jgi:hypothetical protein